MVVRYRRTFSLITYLLSCHACPTLKVVTSGRWNCWQNSNFKISNVQSSKLESVTVIRRAISQQFGNYRS